MERSKHDRRRVTDTMINTVKNDLIDECRNQCSFQLSEQRAGQLQTSSPLFNSAKQGIIVEEIVREEDIEAEESEQCFNENQKSSASMIMTIPTREM